MKPPPISDFDYCLPPELIAQVPAGRRQDSRMMVINRLEGSIKNERFIDLRHYLKKGDGLVLNNTRVIPARLFGRKRGTGGRVEVLLVRPVDDYTWQVLLRPARGLEKNGIIEFEKGLEALFSPSAAGQLRQVKFNKPKEAVLRRIKKIGFYPVPPYIKRSRNDEGLFKTLTALDRRRYQTVYAQKEGAIAAPTAGLHFNRGVLKRLETAGIKILYVTLHVGYGTFRPVKEEDLKKGKLYPEFYSVPRETAGQINRIKKSGGKITVVGTTACRALETAALSSITHDCSCNRRKLKPDKSVVLAEKDFEGWTDLFIYPPFDFKVTDRLLTNFHLPRTSLLMLVDAFCRTVRRSAFCSAVRRGAFCRTVRRDAFCGVYCRTPGCRDRLWRQAYKQAIEEKYRFYSYGDAMFIC